MDLKGELERLQGDYGRVRENNARLSARLQRVENVVEASRQQEQADKTRKRPCRTSGHDTR